VKEKYLRCGVQDRMLVSKRDDRCFFFSVLKVEGMVDKR